MDWYLFYGYLCIQPTRTVSYLCDRLFPLLETTTHTSWNKNVWVCPWHFLKNCDTGSTNDSIRMLSKLCYGLWWTWPRQKFSTNCPSGWLLCLFGFSSPKWWCDDHPLVVYCKKRVGPNIIPPSFCNCNRTTWEKAHCLFCLCKNKQIVDVTAWYSDDDCRQSPWSIGRLTLSWWWNFVWGCRPSSLSRNQKERQEKRS